MEHNRKQKLLMIIALVLSIASLSIGFAAFSVSLNISSQASVSPSSDTFSVKFSTNKDNLVVGAVTPSDNPYSLTTTNGIIDNSTNPTIKGLSATFTNPGQYVEYTFYARNEGEYTAYLNNINFIGNKTCIAEPGTTDSLVQSACDYINISASVGDITYTETTPITGHTLNRKTGERIKVRLEYDSNGVSVDGAFLITFPSVAFVYSTLDDSSIQPTLPIVRLISGNLDTVGSEICIKDECFYLISSTEDTVTMIAKYPLNIREDLPMQTQNSKGEIIYITYSNDNQKGENYSDYKGSIVEGKVNAYYSYLITQGVTPTEARLITKNELSLLGCSTWSCIEAPEFLSSVGNYWTSTADLSDTIWILYNMNVMSRQSYSMVAAVRPVITISKSEF